MIFDEDKLRIVNAMVRETCSRYGKKTPPNDASERDKLIYREGYKMALIILDEVTKWISSQDTWGRTTPLAGRVK